MPGIAGGRNRIEEGALAHGTDRGNTFLFALGLPRQAAALDRCAVHQRFPGTCGVSSCIEMDEQGVVEHRCIQMILRRGLLQRPADTR
ncbi:MAG TPA: hypothetical protein VN624_04320, partial [Rhodanobacter sp.]|nr:hypothetical protein [Rhodanobacter sp.]